MKINCVFKSIVFSICYLYSQPDSRFRPFDWVLYHGSGIINSISEGYNYVYVGTENGGLKRFNTFSLNFDEPITMAQGLKSNKINAVHFDKEMGCLWAATPKFLNYSFSREGNWFSISLESLGLSRYEKIKKIGSSTGHIWLKLNSSYIKLNHTNGFLIGTYSKPDELSIDWSSGPVSFDAKIKKILLEFSFSEGWLFLDNSLIDKLGRKFDITTYFHARHGNIFLGLENGIFFYGTDVMQIFNPINPDINNFDISALGNFEDELFLGSIDYINSKSITQIDTWNENKISFDFEETINMTPLPVFSINASKNELWVGGEDLMLFYDRKKDFWRTFGLETGMPSGKILDINVDSSYVWIATSSGLSRMSRKDKKNDLVGFEYLFSGMPVYQVKSQKNFLWIGAWSGIYLYSKLSPQLKNGMEIGQRYFDQKITHVTAIKVSDDFVYIVGDLGIVKYDFESSVWDLIFNAGVYKNKIVYSIDINGNNIFIGTSDGITKINEKTGFVKEFNFPFLEQVNDIIIIDNYLWAGTNSGLIKFKWKTSL